MKTAIGGRPERVGPAGPVVPTVPLRTIYGTRGDAGSAYGRADRRSPRQRACSAHDSNAGRPVGLSAVSRMVVVSGRQWEVFEPPRWRPARPPAGNNAVVDGDEWATTRRGSGRRAPGRLTDSPAGLPPDDVVVGRSARKRLRRINCNGSHCVGDTIRGANSP